MTKKKTIKGALYTLHKITNSHEHRENEG